MEPAKLKLPRASSLAYKELRKRPESEAAPAADIHAAPIEAPPPPGGDVRAGALTAIRLLQQSYNLRDTTTYSDVVAAFR